VERVCELCEAARITPWFHEDDDCWIAECEACDVPMVVWKVHDPNPSDDVKAMLHEKLAAVVDKLGFEYYVDDNLRSIPGHYHAHARRRRRFI
jgi:spore maturation protein CgeB